MKAFFYDVILVCSNMHIHTSFDFQFTDKSSFIVSNNKTAFFNLDFYTEQ